MPHKIKEEVSLRHTDHCKKQHQEGKHSNEASSKDLSSQFTFISNLHKQTESLRGFQIQPGGDVGAEVFGPGAGVYLEGLEEKKRAHEDWGVRGKRG